MLDNSKSLWKPGDDLSPEIIRQNPEVENDLKTILGQGANQVAKILGQGASLDIHFFHELLDDMKKMMVKINKDSEILENGFQYPVEWLDAFERELNNIHSPESPDIGIVGYGSLQSPQSLASTISQTNMEMVEMKGVKRGLFIPDFGRTKKYWESQGMDQENNSAIMAVKYDSDAVCNGVRIPFPKNSQEWEELKKRESCYEFLPGPTATFANGKIAKLNLICWPIGRNLMNETRKEAVQRWYESSAKLPQIRISFLTAEQTKTFMKLKSAERQKIYLAELQKLVIADEKEQLKELAEGINRSYKRRMAELCSVAARPLPNMAYVHTCLDLTDSKAENRFLNTAYCYNPKGEEITLQEYLKRYAPKTNPKLRSGDGGVDGHSRADILRTQDRG